MNSARLKVYCPRLIFVFAYLLSILMISGPIHADKKKNDPVKNFSLDGRTGSAAPMQAGFINLDGRLHEEVWDNTPVLTGFIQQQPLEGEKATEKTEVRVLYTKDALYIGVIAFDSEPEKISTLLARRDSFLPSDWIRIYIDSYHDHRSAFEFSVNPSGVKRDVFWSDEYRHDDDWDAVWDVGVSQHEQGWSAEFKIPFSQIRFPERDQHTWGFQLSRVIARKNETSFWSRIPRGAPQFCSLFGDLTGIEKIPSPKRLQLMPYALAKGAFEPVDEGDPFSSASSMLANAGLDLKYGVTSNLTLDGTFNPDFGQVEADPGNVNLSAYETYFSEKRPFFMEGNHMLDFKLGNGYEKESLFYSRRIGRNPQGPIENAAYYQRPENTTILGATKLTGKTANGWSIGLLEALTGVEKARVISYDDIQSRQTVEPLTNYFLGKVEKEFRNGRSAVGFILTAVNRNIQEPHLKVLSDAAYSGGMSFRHRWADDTYEISGSMLGSHIRGSEEAISDIQTSSAHYFQRPDAAHIDFDPTRTSLSGYAGAFSMSKIGGDHWRWSIGGRTRSPGFEVNDIGYMREADSIIQSNWLSYREYQPGKIFREYDISLSLWNSWDYARMHEGMGISLRSNFKLLNYWNFDFNINRNQERRSSSSLRGGPSVIFPGNWSLSSNFRTDYRKNLFFSLRGSANISDNDSLTYSLSSGITIRPSDRIHFSISPNISDGFRQLQYVTKESSEQQNHYILSRIEQTTISMTLRLNYTLTPNLSLQLYTQPYISSGDYSEFKEVIDPLAAEYNNRWHIFSPEELTMQDGYYYLHPNNEPDAEYSFYNPDFNYRQFRLNMVVRWEYLPGSTMYLVWTNGINDWVGVGNMNVGKDLKGLFGTPSNNIFLVKFSYWFSI